MQQRIAAPIAGPGWVSAVRGRLMACAEAERGRHFLWLPVLMTSGAVTFFVLRRDPPTWLAAVLLVPALALLLLAWLRALPRAVASCAVAAALGFAAAQLATSLAPPLMEVPTRAVVAEGTVRAVEPLPEGRRVTLEAARLDDGPVLGRLLRIRLRTNDTTPVAAGDTLRLRTLLMRPQPPAYPGAWDLQRDAYYQGFGAFGMALGTAERVAEGAGARPVQRLREAIAARIGLVLSGSTAAIATTMLTGNSSAIPEADRRTFRDAGLAHLLAIAGLHLGIVMGLVFAAARLALAMWEWAALHWPTKQIAAVAALLAAVGYMLLTGVHLPVQRSIAMACLFTLAVLVGRRALSLRGLALAMAALVLLEPHQVMGVSFQMSFSAVLALIVGYERLQPWLTRLRGEGTWRRRLLANVVALAVTAALAGTFSAPFAAYRFGQVQLYNVLANMVAVPITALLIMPAGLLSLPLMLLHAEVVALVPMGRGIAAVLWVGRTVSSWPAATIIVPHMPPWGLAVLAVGLAWIGLWRTRIRLAGLALLVLGLASPIFAPPPDLLMSADGRMVGLRDANGMYVQTAGGAANFTLDSWRVLWRARLVQPLGCGMAPCELRPRPRGPTALLVHEDAPESVCAGAVAVVSLEPLRLHCTVPMIDRFSVWREGAYAIWLSAPTAVVLSDRQERGSRIWMPDPTARNRLTPGLKPVPAEELPAE